MDGMYKVTVTKPDGTEVTYEMYAHDTFDALATAQLHAEHDAEHEAGPERDV